MVGYLHWGLIILRKRGLENNRWFLIFIAVDTCSAHDKCGVWNRHWGSLKTSCTQDFNIVAPAMMDETMILSNKKTSIFSALNQRSLLTFLFRKRYQRTIFATAFEHRILSSTSTFSYNLEKHGCSAVSWFEREFRERHEEQVEVFQASVDQRKADMFQSFLQTSWCVFDWSNARCSDIEPGRVRFSSISYMWSSPRELHYKCAIVRFYFSPNVKSYSFLVIHLANENLVMIVSW